MIIHLNGKEPPLFPRFMHEPSTKGQNVPGLLPHHAGTDRFNGVSALWGIFEGGFR